MKNNGRSQKGLNEQDEYFMPSPLLGTRHNVIEGIPLEQLL
jgi:hypothetical protein